MALQPGDTTESESDSAERLEQVDRLAPARGIAIGVIIAALFWGALAVLVFRLRR